VSIARDVLDKIAKQNIHTNKIELFVWAVPTILDALAAQRAEPELNTERLLF
jgi:hypothetical protein